MNIFSPFESFLLFGNTGADYAIAFGIFLGSLIFLKIFQLLLLNRVRVLAKKTVGDLDDIVIDIITGIHVISYVLISLYISAQFLSLPEGASRALWFIFVIVFVYEAVRAAQRLVDFGLRKFLQKKNARGHKKSEGIVRAGNLIASFILWSIGLLLMLSNLGINVTSLIASLGIGGIAVALALQNIFSDIFSSFSIYIDKPFEVGDFIIIDKNSGTVERIGLKTTRLRTLRGEELVVSNKELTTVRIQNLKKIETRREIFTISVAYETPGDVLAAIPGMFRDVINEIADTEFERCHFVQFGDFGLDFEISYFFSSGDYIAYLESKHELNLAIKRRFEKENIVFPYPTQHVIVETAKKKR